MSYQTYIECDGCEASEAVEHYPHPLEAIPSPPGWITVTLAAVSSMDDDEVLHFHEEGCAGQALWSRATAYSSKPGEPMDAEVVDGEAPVFLGGDVTQEVRVP